MNQPDESKRTQALDCTRSFIIQAPAGSGKTSLLVSRFLKLLSRVNAPEEITAITFTRKAAFEMRSRIIAALKKAAQNTCPENNYETATFLLAKNALQQDQLKQWNIIQNPSRLRIQTIDSFCGYLVSRMPLKTKTGTKIQIVENQEAENYYHEAARSIFENLSEPKYADYLECLLLHLDNDWSRTENLFVAMLKSREQWLPHIAGLKNGLDLRSVMEESLQTICQENLEHVQESLPKELQNELLTLLEFAKNHLENPPIFLTQCHFNEKPTQNNFKSWRWAAEILLLRDFSWRKQITKKYGFPASSSGRTKEEKILFREMKQRLEDLIAQLRLHENFRISLENLLCSPPIHYNDDQWKIIESLLKLLPLLAAHLQILFNEHGSCDHAEISMAALRALGCDDSPSDLALSLDYKLQHLLIDEFQDTSVEQFRLLEKLVTSWQENDGHTLFLVGDPMQSIYRFREAEVGLFLRAQLDGIGAIKLHPLTLTTNFRSNKNIVDWVNANFAAILPQIPDISLGAVPFHPATAIKYEPNSRVKIELLENYDDDNETLRAVLTVQEILKNDPESTIAILVKARSHLQKIIPKLRMANLPYQASEIEKLNECTIIRDLFALTRALFHIADRIAWLAILRAPWCGITLKDLHKIANGTGKIIWDNICNYQTLELSADGILRIEKLKNALAPIFTQRGRTTWLHLIKTAWFNLGGPATVANEPELKHADIYFNLLATDNFDITTLQKKLSSLYAPNSSPAKIQLMTIHKAKGLEFDHVIIPRIDKTTRADVRKLLLWFERPNLHTGTSLLLAPLEIGTLDKSTRELSLYQYLRLIDKKKSFFETGRLLYVAITRAKKSAYLIGSLKNDDNQENISDSIPQGSLLEQLIPCFDKNWLVRNCEKVNPVISTTVKNSGILRLPKDWQSPITPSIPQNNIAPICDFTDQDAAIIGTAIHHCLRQICELGIADCGEKYLARGNSYFKKILMHLGCINIERGLEMLSTAINQTINDTRGQWILQTHKNSACELALTTKIGDQLAPFIIDRTFVDDKGICWIIDYKTSTPKTNEEINNFFAREKEKYSDQLLNYAKIMRDFAKNSHIKLGLYFPLLSGWLEIT